MSMASSGDTLELGPGIFRGSGNRDLDPGGAGKADLTFRGRQGKEATIVDLEDAGRFLYFSALAGRAVVANLTLVNGNCAGYPEDLRRGGGIAIVQANVTLTDLIMQQMNCISNTEVYGGDFSGGAIYLQSAGSLLQRLVIQDCNANHGAAIACWGTEQSTVEDSIFERNYGKFWGGTVLTEQNSQTTFRRCSMSYGSSPYGGHVDDSATAAATFIDCTFEYGSAEEGGAYLGYGQTNLVFINCSFSHNVASSIGGAMSLSERTHPTFVGVNFTNNSAFTGGAVISAYTGVAGPILFKNVRFTRNVARSKCVLKLMNWATFEDTVFEENSNQCICTNSLPGHGLVIRDSRFVRNVALDSGGAIVATMESSASTPAPLELSGVTFDSNVALGIAGQSGGGAVAVTGLHAVTVVNCTFVNNSAANLGGALAYIPGGALSVLPVTINDTFFARNRGNASGGSLYIGGCNQQALSLSMARSTVMSSSTFGDGGGALLDTAVLLIQDTDFLQNVAMEGSGGGLVLGPTPNCGAGSGLMDVGFVGNRARLGGGALYFMLAVPTSPPCAVPTVPGQPDVWNAQAPSAWFWTKFGKSVSNNTAGFGLLQATSPVHLEAACAGPGAFAGLGTCAVSGGGVAISGFPGMPLGLSVQLHDVLEQVYRNEALLVEAVLLTTSVNGTSFLLDGPSRFHFDKGTATLSDANLVASGFPSTSVQLVLAIQLPFALRASPMPQVQVTITIDGSQGPCPAGFVPGRASMGVHCTPCPSGSFASVGDAACIGCPTGRFASSPGSASCAICPVGSGCPAGTSLPAPCAAGTYQSQVGQERCKACDQGFYGPLTGQAECLKCPNGTSTKLEGADEIADCVCQQGSFMEANTSTCQPCTEGMECPTGSTSPGQAADFYVQLSGAVPGAFRCAQFQCVAGAPGSCAPGREGFVCARCQQGFYPSGGACVACQASDVLPFVVSIVASLCLLALLIFLARTDVSKQSLQVLTALSVAGQALVAVQMLTMINKIGIRWPGSVRALLDIVAILRFDFGPLRYQCVVGSDSPLMSFILQLLAFPAAVAALLVIALGLWLCRRPVPRDDLCNNTGMLVTMCFLPATVMAVTPFDCVASPNGSLSVKKLPAILCGQPLHDSLIAVGAIAVLCYTGTVLCGAGLVTFYYPRIIAGGGGLRLLRRFRFLFYRFKPTAYYYGFIFLLRSAVMTLIPLVSQAGTEVLGFAFVVAVFGFLQCTLQPWRTTMSNLTDAVFSLLLLMLLMAVGTLQDRAPSSSNASATFVLVVLLLVLLSPLVLLGVIGFKLLYDRGAGRKRFKLFISHHKTDAASLARYVKHTAGTRANAQAFLDSDQLQDLDTLLDAVRSHTQHLVLLLTKETLRRPWCAGEIVMAHKCGVPITVVPCGAVELFSDEEISSLKHIWAPEQLHQLQVMGLSIEDIQAAYKHLRTVEMLRLPSDFDSLVELHALHEALRQVLQVCGLTSWRPAVHQSQRDAHALVLANSGDLDAVAGALLLQEMVQAQAQLDISLCLNAEEVSIASDPAAALIFLTPGCMESKEFMAAACLAMSNVTNIVCVQGHPNFRHPDSSSLPALVQRMTQVLGQEHEESLQQTYARFLSLIAVPFSPGLNKQMVDAQVELLAKRVRKADKSPFRSQSWTTSWSPSKVARRPEFQDRAPGTGPGIPPYEPEPREAASRLSI